MISARWAQVPRLWADSNGHERLVLNAGLFQPSVVILMQASGEVRLVALMCGPDQRVLPTDFIGNFERPTVCSPQGEVWGQYLVGAKQPPILGR